MLQRLSHQPLDLNDLPRYSPWFPLLLDLEKPQRSFSKTSESLTREYGRDKWGTLLNNITSYNVSSISEIDLLAYGTNVDSPFYHDNQFFLALSHDINSFYFQFVRSYLYRLVRDFNIKHIVDLGSGYGALPFKLMDTPGFKDVS